MTAVGKGSKPEEGDGADHEALPSVIRQPESYDPISEIEVLGEMMPPEDTSGSVPPAEEHVFKVARVARSVLLPGPRS